MRDTAAAVAHHPNPLTIDPALQLAAAAVLLEEGVEGGEKFRHYPPGMMKVVLAVLCGLAKS